MSQDIATLGIRVDARQVQEGDRALDSFERTGQRAGRTSEQLNATMAKMAKMAAAVTAALGLAELVKMADTWASLNGRLALVTESSAGLLRVQEKLFDLAQRTRGGLEGTVDLYAKLTKSTKDLGTTEAQRLRATETINKAMVIGGTAADAQAGALRQLGQAFASGVLRGDEFNSVLEASPRLIEAIGAGMGRTQGEMRALAEQGKLTSAAIMNGLVSQGAAIDAEFERMPKTIAQALTVVQNSLLRTVGMFDQTNQLSAGLAGTMTTLANNINLVVGAVTGLVATSAANFMVGLAKGIYASVAATTADIAAKRAAAAAAVMSTAATVAETGAVAASTAARLAELRAVVILAPAQERLFLTTTALIPAQQRAAAASAAHAAALTAQTAASGAAAGVAGLAGRSLALLGGPIGLITLALGLGAAAWAAWGTKAKDAETEAAQTVHDKSAEILKDLDSQIVKLIERNRLMNLAPEVAKGESAAAKQQQEVLTEMNRVAKDGNLNTAVKTELLRVLGGEYNALTQRVSALDSEQKKLNATQNAGKKADWIAKNTKFMSDTEKLAAAIKAAKTELGDAFDDEIEKRIRDDFASDALSKSAEKAATALKATQDYIKGMKQEREEIGLTERQVFMLRAEREALKAATPALAASVRSNAAALFDERAAFEANAEEMKKFAEAFKAVSDGRVTDLASAKARVAALQDEVNTYGLGASAVLRYANAKLQAKVSGLGQGDEAEIVHLRALIAENEKMIALADRKSDLDALFETSKVESFGDALRDAFGSGGSALGKLGDQLQAFNDKEDKAAKDRAAAMLKFDGDKGRQAAAVGKIDAAQAKSRIGAYADMAGAAKGFFKENTKGYKAMEAIERGYRVWEMALAVKSMVTKMFATTSTTAAAVTGSAATAAAATAGAATEVTAKMAVAQASAVAGVANQAAGDPYTAFGRMAAMAAIMGGLGLAVAVGGGSHGGGGKTAAEVQKAQGAGGVFGDGSAKSDSLAQSLDRLAGNSNIALSYSAGMLSALRSIEASMLGLANLVVRSPGVINGSNMGIAEGKISGPTGLIAKIGGGVTKALFGPGLGDKIASLWGKTTQNIVDSGISFGGGVRDLQAGKGFNQYASVDTTKSSFFGLRKSTSNSVQSQGLDAGLASQFGQIFKNLEPALNMAAQGVGRSVEEVTKAFDTMTLDAGVSLKGLSGDALTEALNAVISKAMDDIAQAALPGFDAFRQVGEGYAETVIRVAAGIDEARFELDKFGMSAIAYGDILNKQGDVAAEIVRQTITNAERASGALSGVGEIMQALDGTASDLSATYGELQAVQSLMTEAGLDAANLGRSMIRGAGDLATLQAGYEDYFGSFFDESEQLAAKTETMAKRFAALGVAMPTDKSGFRELVESIPMATENGRKLAGQIIALSGGFADLFEDATSADKMEDAFSVLEKSINAEKKLREAAHEAELARIDASLKAQQAALSKLQSLSKDLHSTLDRMRAPGDDGLGSRANAQAQIKAAILMAKAGGVFPDSGSLTKSLSVLSEDSSGMYASYKDYQRDFLKTAIDISELTVLTDTAVTRAEAQIAATERVRAALEAAHAAEMAKLDEELEKAQNQMDALNGINNSVLSVAEALRQFAAANPIQQAYQSSLGRGAEQAGLDYWTGQAAGGVPMAAILKAIKASDEAVAYTAGSATASAAQSYAAPLSVSSSAGNNAAPAVDVNAIVAEIKAGNEKAFAAMYQVAKNTGRNADSSESMVRNGVLIQEP